MDERAAMLAGPIEKSMNLGPEWTVAGVRFEEGLPAGDELHIFIERTPGFAADLEAHGGDAAAVQSVTCDLSPAFASGVAEHLPNARRVADRFHVMQIANRQLDLVRAKEAKAELDRLTSWIMHSNVPQMKKLARTLRDNEAEVLSYFDSRLTNAILEGMNSVIQPAKRAARGFRNIEYFKTVIYLKLGKLPLVEATCATH